MPNPVLDGYRAQRDEQISTMDAILGQVEDRDLVDAERGILESARQRIAELDAMIEPLANFETLREQHTAASSSLPAPAPAVQRARIDGVQPRPIYRTPGEFLVDYIRANGILDRNQRDDAAASRVYQARADQTTTQTPGLLPVPIVGAVVDLIDANRPLIQSLGGSKGMGAIPDKSFTRPKIATHTQSGIQSAEKTALSSRAMVINAVTFNKETHGGYVDISRQDIDWTSPAAWDILIRDLGNQYAIDTETTISAAFATAATGTTPALPATPVLADWTKGLYTAAMHSYQAGQRMPTRIWCSLDVWAALGSLVDTTRVILPPDSSNTMTDLPMDSWDAGASSLANFRGDVLGLPRIVVPLFPSKTCIVGPDNLYEVYEETIGLLSVVEPSILGVQVAYGGYVAYGTLAGGAYVALNLSAVTSLPTMAEMDADTEEAPADDTSGGGVSGGRKAR